MDEMTIEEKRQWLVKARLRALRLSARRCLGITHIKSAQEMVAHEMEEASREQELTYDGVGLLTGQSGRNVRRPKLRDDPVNERILGHVILDVLVRSHPTPLTLGQMVAAVGERRDFQDVSYARMEEVLEFYVRNQVLRKEQDTYGLRREGTGTVKGTPEELMGSLTLIAEAVDGCLWKEHTTSWQNVYISATEEEYLEFVAQLQLEIDKLIRSFAERSTSQGQQQFTIILIGTKGVPHE